MPYQLGRTASHEGALVACPTRLQGTRQRTGTHAADVTIPARLRGDAVQRCFWALRCLKGEDACLCASPC